MSSVTDLSHLLVTARTRAGLSQHDLAARAGTSQSAIARIERGQANPTIATLERILAAAGFQLQGTIVPVAPTDTTVAAYKRDVDRTMIRENLRRSIDERLRLNSESLLLGDELQRAVSARRPKR